MKQMLFGEEYTARGVPKMIAQGAIFVRADRGPVPDWVPEYEKNKDGSLLPQTPETTVEVAQGLRRLVETAGRGWLENVGIAARFLEPTDYGFPTRILTVAKQAGHMTIVAGAQRVDEIEGKIWRFGPQKMISTGIVFDALSGIIKRELVPVHHELEPAPPSLSQNPQGFWRGIFEGLGRR